MPSTLADDRLNRPILEFARQDYISISVDLTVGGALKAIQNSRSDGRIVYFYVVDDEHRLQGVIPTRKLLLSAPEVPVADIMIKEAVVVPTAATLLDACDLFLFHRLLALPIVDEEKHLKGVVDVELYTDELSDLARKNEHDDIFQIIGVHVSALRKASTAGVFWSRFPWLLCNVSGGLACAIIGGLYQEVLDQVVALALFIPVVLALAESVSIQSLTLTLQSQHGGAGQKRHVLRSLFQEIPVGVLLGGACGFLVALAAGVWQGNWMVAACLFLSILTTITLATLFGLLVPTLFKAFKRDPKVASGPISLALTDLTTLFCYLQLATLLLI